MQCHDGHKKLNVEGVGMCSVPMWRNGVPSGFCDAPAYGEYVKGETFRNGLGETQRFDGKFCGYVPYLACPRHGGPEKETKQPLTAPQGARRNA